MAKTKKVVKHLTGKVNIKATLSQLRDPAQAKGPRQIGQLKRDISVRIGKVTRDEVVKRLDAAEAILTTGKVPAAVKGGSSKTKDATLAKCQDKLKKAQEDLAKVKDDLKASHEGYHDLKVMYEELLVKCEGEEPKADPAPEATDPVDPAQE